MSTDVRVGAAAVAAVARAADWQETIVERIRTEEDGGVLRLVFVAPERRNAVDHSFGHAFAEAIDGPVQLARCLEIVSEGPDFCVGGDIGLFRDNPEHGVALAELLHEAQTALLALDIPVVVGVQGWAVGIGLSLALTADILVLGATARLRTAYTAIGLTPDGGLSATLPAAVGRAWALDMLLTNRVMNAQEALQRGLTSRVVADGDVRAEADAVAARLAAGPPSAYRSTKRLVRDATGIAVTPEHLAAEARNIGLAAASPEGREGMAASTARRSPCWRGRPPEQ